MLTNEDIIRIHNKVDMPQYNDDVMKYNDGNWKWEGKEFSRVVSLIEFRKMMWGKNIPIKNMLTMNSTNDPELEYVNADNITSYDYLSNPELYDLHTMDLDKKDYDFFMSNQTLEHLYDPLGALKNVNRHLESGGYLYMNVPCNNIPHDTPVHFYTGFTSVGLGALVELSGFEIVNLGQWGNSNGLIKLFTEGWVDYTKSDWNNEKECPMVCWVLARKIKEM